MESLAYEGLSEIERRLVDAAIEVRAKAYAPYSRYLVGSALVDEKGGVHTGCNIEGADYTLTTHAEMGAINAMVKTGVHRLAGMAVAVKSGVGWGMPCGLCRQKIREFAGKRNVPVIGVNLDASEKIAEIYRSTLDELLPFSFGPDFL